MAKFLVSFGANLGDPQATIRAAAERLRLDLACQPSNFRISRFYHTPPVGGPTGQPPFINAVAAINAPVTAWELWHIVRQVEKDFGRERFQRWEARRIDVDILLCDAHRIWTPQLKIPHPRLCMRRFILIPACDVAGDWLDPVSGLTINQLCQTYQSKSGLILAGNDPKACERVANEVANQAMARIQSVTKEQLDRGNIELRSTVSRIINVLDSNSGELLQTLSDLTENQTETPLPVPLVYWTNAAEIEGAQWEDQHSDLARELGLNDAGVPTLSQRVIGPRYLLATPDAEWATHELVAAMDAMDCPVEPMTRRSPKLPPRKSASHKGTYGNALLIGGSRGLAGAIAMSAMSAGLAGAGLVRVATADRCLETVASFSPCYTTIPLKDDPDGKICAGAVDLTAEIERSDAIAIGPGLGQSEELHSLVWELLQKATCPVIVDADGLNNLRDLERRQDAWQASRVLTPHPGEWQRLSGVPASDRTAQIKAAIEKAALLGVTIVLKGQNTFITDGDQQTTNTTGTPALATGGSGDVLTGLICALICQGLSAYEASVLGVQAHGLAGEIAEQELDSHVVLPTQLINYLPKALTVANQQAE